MKRMKQLYLAMVAFFYHAAAFAAGSGGDPFQKATEKTDQISGYLAGGIAIALTVLVITVAGFALMFNKLRQETALRIMGGAIVIGSASSIAAFIFA